MCILLFFVVVLLNCVAELLHFVYKFGKSSATLTFAG